jgi:hypothetical protein
MPHFTDAVSANLDILLVLSQGQPPWTLHLTAIQTEFWFSPNNQLGFPLAANLPPPPPPSPIDPFLRGQRAAAPSPPPLPPFSGPLSGPLSMERGFTGSPSGPQGLKQGTALLLSRGSGRNTAHIPNVGGRGANSRRNRVARHCAARQRRGEEEEEEEEEEVSD